MRDITHDPNIPLDTHAFPLPPDYGDQETHISSGMVTGFAPEQPIPFTHYRHATELGMDCQYCHSEARKSRHSGVPPLQTCMGCHSWVKKDSPHIQKLTEYWKNGEGELPPQWSKVHDIPDFVHFAHKPHIRAGVDCTECHGDKIAEKGKFENGTTNHVMSREKTLQMGFCLDCHANHPTVDKNYGEKADLRRAELKDCWTCHK